MKLDKNKYLLKKINFTIKPEEKVALFFFNESEKNAFIYSIFRCEQILPSKYHVSHLSP